MVPPPGDLTSNRPPSARARSLMLLAQWLCDQAKATP